MWSYFAVYVLRFDARNFRCLQVKYSVFKPQDIPRLFHSRTSWINSVIKTKKIPTEPAKELIEKFEISKRSQNTSTTKNNVLKLWKLLNIWWTFFYVMLKRFLSEYKMYRALKIQLVTKDLT